MTTTSSTNNNKKVTAKKTQLFFVHFWQWLRYIVGVIWRIDRIKLLVKIPFHHYPHHRHHHYLFINFISEAMILKEKKNIVLHQSVNVKSTIFWSLETIESQRQQRQVIDLSRRVSQTLFNLVKLSCRRIYLRFIWFGKHSSNILSPKTHILYFSLLIFYCFLNLLSHVRRNCEFPSNCQTTKEHNIYCQLYRDEQRLNKENKNLKNFIRVKFFLSFSTNANTGKDNAPDKYLGHHKPARVYLSPEGAIRCVIVLKHHSSGPLPLNRDNKHLSQWVRLLSGVGGWLQISHDRKKMLAIHLRRLPIYFF